MRIEWDFVALQDRGRIFEFLYSLNPVAAEWADNELVEKVNLLLDNPGLGKSCYGQVRKLLINLVSLLVVYIVADEVIRIMAVAHQREKFPD